MKFTGHSSLSLTANLGRDRLLQLKLFACVLGVPHKRTQDIRPAQAG